jgi:hypothetical protein
MVGADTRFTDEPELGKSTEENIKPFNVGIIMLLTVLFAPITVTISVYPWQGIMWLIQFVFFTISYSEHGGFAAWSSIIDLPDYIQWLRFLSIMLPVYVGPRLVFSYQLVRLYKGKTTRGRTLVLGFIADCYLLPLMILEMLVFPSEYFITMLPIPVVLFIALMLLKFKPPPVVITPWKEPDEPQKR